MPYDCQVMVNLVAGIQEVDPSRNLLHPQFPDNEFVAKRMLSEVKQEVVPTEEEWPAGTISINASAWNSIDRLYIHNREDSRNSLWIYYSVPNGAGEPSTEMIAFLSPGQSFLIPNIYPASALYDTSGMSINIDYNTRDPDLVGLVDYILLGT